MKFSLVAYDRPNYRAGPIVNARRLLPELVARGHQVSALILFHAGASPTALFLRARGVDVRTMPWKASTEKHVRWMLGELQTIQPDIFVPNLSTAGWFAARWCREAGIPTIAAYRSPDPYHQGMIEQFVIGLPEWSVSGLVCVNRLMFRQVNSLAPAHTQLCVIPSGVPMDDDHKASRQGPLRLAYVGRLEDHAKRITDTVDALIRLIRIRPEIKATIYGEGSRQTALEQRVASKGLSQAIRFGGAVEPERLHGELCRHDALVLLSEFEGLPAAVMDAMSCGLVPICTNFPGIEELVINGVTGLVVDDRDQQFNAAVIRLADDPDLWQSLSSQARQHIAANYSLTICADRWEQFCGELQATAGPRKPISLPPQLQLPAVHPWLAKEDIRGNRLWQATLRSGVRLVKQIPGFGDSTRS